MCRRTASGLVRPPRSASSPDRGEGRAPGRLSGFKTRLRALTCSSGCAFVLVDEASQDGSAPDSLVGEVRHGMIGARREETQRSVRAPFVVVGGVPSEDGPQVSFAEDQDSVVSPLALLALRHATPREEGQKRRRATLLIAVVEVVG